MWIEHITNTQALMFVAGVFMVAWIVFKLIPSPDADESEYETFTKDEIAAYDGELPKYFLAAAFALFLGSLHTVIKNLPGFWQWLWEAGYGGHLFRDLSNSHIIIVGGGTVLLTAFTWYALPRFVNRPLYSKSLASISFWLTIVGVFGFYLSWMILGLVEGNMVRQGMDYQAAKDLLGNYHRLPTGLTSSIMGFGYWSYVLNVFLTVFVARKVQSKPLNYLTKFSIVSAAGLFVGTVQGVIQVMPDNADWIHEAGHFGEYVDPISHAHINLVTGMIISLIAFLAFFSSQMDGINIKRKEVNLTFWVMASGSLAFYFTFLFLGLILGGAEVDASGIQAPELVTFLRRWQSVLLAVSGSWMLLGFWMYFRMIWRSLGRNIWTQVRDATPAGFWLVSGVALFIGTLQGLLQAIPTTHEILTIAEEIPNIHAQLNMVGGVLIALIGLVNLLLPELLEESINLHLRRISLSGISAGIGLYYLATMTTGLIRAHYLQQGMTDLQAAIQLTWIAPLILFLSAIPMLIGYTAFGLGLWRITADYRKAWFANLQSLPNRYHGDVPEWQKNIPVRNYLMIEAIGAIFGFPGIGWIFSGHALWGIPLALAGPGIAWAIIPMLFSPYGDGGLKAYGATALLMYLLITTTLSVMLLWFMSSKQQYEAEL